MAENKELKAYKSGERAKDKKGGKRRSKMVVHLIPDVLDTLGVATPAIDSNFWDGLEPGNFDPSWSVGQIGASYMNGQELLQGASLVIVGEAVRYLGKHTRLGRIGSKKVKLA